MSNLNLTRRPGESINITLEDKRVINVAVTEVRGNQARLLINAPRTIIVDRDEITRRKEAEAPQP